MARTPGIPLVKAATAINDVSRLQRYAREPRPHQQASFVQAPHETMTLEDLGAEL